MSKTRSLFSRLQRLSLARQLQRHAIDDALWHSVTRNLPLLHRYSAVEKARLRVLATLFLQKKSFTGAHGFEVTPQMEVVIAAQACVPILELDIDLYDGWHSVIVYPDAFVVEHEVEDEFGLVHEQSRVLGGEAWSQGPVILAWDDVARDSFQPHPGHHVVIHEFTHKLDMGNGVANGMPPLPLDMPVEAWTQAFSEAFDRLNRRLVHHHADIDPYAASDPAEFFAVCCEYFFTAPEILWQHYPRVYRQLRRYFRQDPLARRRYRKSR